MAEPDVKKTSLAPWWVWLLLGLGIMVVLAAFYAIIVWAPAHLVEQRKASDDSYLKAITDNRTALVQAAGGFGVFLGVVVGVLTLQHNRQLLRESRKEHEESLKASRDALEKTLGLTERGQITDRFSKAIEQLGRVEENAVDLRLGGIYALEQIANDSPVWHQPVVEVLAAFTRQHASGSAPPDGATVEIQLAAIRGTEGRYVSLRADVEAAIAVLSRRDRTKDKLSQVDLNSADFRRINFSSDANFSNTDFSKAQMQFSGLMFADLSLCYFFRTKLQGADLEKTDLRKSFFLGANLIGADMKDARLEGAQLRATDLTGALNMTIDQLKVADISKDTKLPDYIDRAELLRAMESPFAAS